MVTQHFPGRGLIGRPPRAITGMACRALLASLLVAPANGLAVAAPRVESDLSATETFLEANLIYTVRVYSQRELETLDVEWPDDSGLTVDHLEGEDRARRATVDGRPGVVTERFYRVKPSRLGTLELPPARVTAVAKPNPNTGYDPRLSGYPGPYGQPPGYGYPPYNRAYRRPSPDDPASRSTTTATAAHPIEVRPAVHDGRALLPLHDAALTAEWSRESAAQAPAVGEPLTLTLELTAHGVAASQIPALGEALSHPRAKFYAERAQLENRFEGQRPAVIGVRREVYTVVPSERGRLELPALQFRWWAGDHARTTTTTPEALYIGSRGETARTALTLQQPPEYSLLDPESLHGFWLPVSLALASAFVVGWWIGVGHRGIRRFARRLRRLPGALQGQAQRAPRQLRAWAGRQRRRRLVCTRPLVRRVASRLMPAPLKVAWYLHCIQTADDATRVEQLLLWFASHHLGLPENSPLPAIGAHFAHECHGPRRGRIIQSLFQELDRALYGEGDLRLRDWQGRFRRALPIRILVCRRTGSAAGRDPLPELNPF